MRSLPWLVSASLALTACPTVGVVVPASDSTPPSALWVQADIPGQPLANVFLGGANLVAEAGVGDQVVLTAHADDPDGGLERLSMWSTTKRTRDTGQIEGPSLAGAPDAEFLSSAAVGDTVDQGQTVSWTLDLATLTPGWDDVDVDVWADAENFHGGVSTSPVLTIHAGVP